jgi:recombination protein RecT
MNKALVRDARELKEFISSYVEREFKNILEGMVHPSRFIQSFLITLQNEPLLLQVDRQDLVLALRKAALAGLLPDGQEGAIVVYQRRDRTPKAEWIPMTRGLIKAAFESGAITNFWSHIVYKGDKFIVQLGDEEKIIHERNFESSRQEPIAAYAIATLRSGALARYVMSWDQIMRHRDASRSANAEGSPWRKWPEEMALKTVVRQLLLKRIPPVSQAQSRLGAALAYDDSMSSDDPVLNAPEALAQHVIEEGIPIEPDMPEEPEPVPAADAEHRSKLDDIFR